MGRGREGELWDDSALITAFDDAMSKYKKMHGLSTKSEDVDTSSDAAESLAQADACTGEVRGTDDQTPGDLISVREVSGSSNATLDVAKGDTGQGHELANGNQVSGSGGPEAYVKSFDDQSAQAYQGYTNSHAAEDYNKLLTEYYEIEERRQAVLQQLQHIGGYDHQYAAEGSGSGYDATLGACSASYYHTLPAGQASLPSAVCCCCPCAAHCSMAACPFPGCSMSETCVDKECGESAPAAGPGKPSPSVDVFKTAVEAAEAALSSLKVKTPGDSGIKGKENQKDIEGVMIHSNTSETDISMVLKAWFSAGLYTGKYLTEQSIKKK